MKDYIPKSEKSAQVKKLINEALDILHSVGIPFEDQTPRRLERMAMAFLAVAGVTKSWKDAKGQAENRHLKTREIISFINENFEEKISPGSYDDIRREALSLPHQAGLILNSANKPSAAKSDPTRGFSISSEFRTLLTFYNSKQWDIRLNLFCKNRPTLSELLERKRNLPKVKITLPSGETIQFSQGAHNELQREIVEQFLTRFGGEGCTVLYIGDTENKFSIFEKEKLHELGFFDISQGLLPDIIAYNSKKNWLFLIEAFNVTGTMSDERILKLQKALKDCKAGLIFVTAFTSRTVFYEHVKEIGWESEVWTADRADHMVHFNGGKFLGPMS